MDVLQTRSELRNGFSIQIDRVVDPDGDVSFLTGPERYSDLPPAERRTYEQADAERLRAYQRDEWCMVGVLVTIRKQTASNWADGGLEVGRASLWAIESDSEPAYFTEVENDLIAEALAEVERLRAVLCGAAS